MIEMEPKDEWIGRALTDTEKLRSKDDILLIVREGHGDR